MLGEGEGLSFGKSMGGCEVGSSVTEGACPSVN